MCVSGAFAVAGCGAFVVDLGFLARKNEEKHCHGYPEEGLATRLLVRSSISVHYWLLQQHSPLVFEFTDPNGVTHCVSSRRWSI